MSWCVWLNNKHTSWSLIRFSFIQIVLICLGKTVVVRLCLAD
ncbi:hypothetical protein E2C01_009619 [Portunus trituberculatus]|uniref:Uncharacterized protein n=1 Tax=Portunus trituberculatus TaxID=210409 RepID=A0A5B7D692_PORTR|nr:hypothetical protein [Portunus trituberculatus]